MDEPIARPNRSARERVPLRSQAQHQQPLASRAAAYELCRQITAECAKTFYLGTLLMPRAKRQAIWAIYVWCRRTDELLDGPEAQATTAETLERWEQRLESVFAGYPHDNADVALADTLERFPLEMQPFRDMIAGQRMDLTRNRYETFAELHRYCYCVAGTVGLMSLAVLGTRVAGSAAPWRADSSDYNPAEEAIALGVANQLTNILRDVGEDAQRNRIYLPREDLAAFGYTERDLFAGVVDERWRALARFEIQRARAFYAQAESGICYLSPDARWPVWTALMLYRGIMGAIERNRYDVFRRRASVSKPRKAACLPVAWARAQAL